MTQDSSHMLGLSPVLILDDDPVVGIGLEADLVEMGCADVSAFTNTDEVFRYLDVVRPACAVIDFNLERGRTSEGVALELTKLGVPFVFLTGFGNLPQVDPVLENAPVICKPVDLSKLSSLLRGIAC